mgnify:CR=1 FL=1
MFRYILISIFSFSAIAETVLPAADTAQVTRLIKPFGMIWDNQQNSAGHQLDQSQADAAKEVIKTERGTPCEPESSVLRANKVLQFDKSFDGKNMFFEGGDGQFYHDFFFRIT